MGKDHVHGDPKLGTRSALWEVGRGPPAEAGLRAMNWRLCFEGFGSLVSPLRLMMFIYSIW